MLNFTGSIVGFDKLGDVTSFTRSRKEEADEYVNICSVHDRIFAASINCLSMPTEKPGTACVSCVVSCNVNANHKAFHMQN